MIGEGLEDIPVAQPVSMEEAIGSLPVAEPVEEGGGHVERPPAPSLPQTADPAPTSSPSPVEGEGKGDSPSPSGGEGERASGREGEKTYGLQGVVASHAFASAALSLAVKARAEAEAEALEERAAEEKRAEKDPSDSEEERGGEEKERKVSKVVFALASASKAVSAILAAEEVAIVEDGDGGTAGAGEGGEKGGGKGGQGGEREGRREGEEEGARERKRGEEGEAKVEGGGYFEAEEDISQPAERGSERKTDFGAGLAFYKGGGGPASSMSLLKEPSEVVGYTLFIKVIRAKGLLARDANGLSDPYVKVRWQMGERGWW